MGKVSIVFYFSCRSNARDGLYYNIFTVKKKKDYTTYSEMLREDFLLAQHEESSIAHLGLLRACLDLDPQHANTYIQSQQGLRCLTHQTHPIKT